MNPRDYHTNMTRVFNSADTNAEKNIKTHEENLKKTEESEKEETPVLEDVKKNEEED